MIRQIGRAGLCSLGLLLASGGQALQIDPDGRPSAIFDTRTARGFGDPRPALRRYLASRHGRPRGVQHVCVVGYGTGDDRVAQAHWREGRRLILWEGSDPADPGDLLGWGRRDLDLTRDVASTEAAIGSSTYRVSRSWVRRVLADCAARGTRYLVIPAPRRRP